MLGNYLDLHLLSKRLPPGLSQPGKRKAKGEQATQHKARVLVVDDQHLIVDTIAEILEIYNFHPFAAYVGESALALAARIKPDYLLADVLMPGMNGVELAIAVKSLLPHTRILLFTGQAGTSSILHRAAEEGHEFQVIPKPIHPEKLMQILRKKD